MLTQLEAHLKLLQDTGADATAIANAKEMIKKEKQRLSTIESVAEAELEQMRTDQLSGINKHLKELNNVQAGFNLARKKLLEERNQMAAGAARDAKNQELLELEDLEKINKLRIKSAEEINAKFEDFGFVTDFTKSKTGRFLSDMEGAFTALGATMSSALKPANLFAAGMDQMVSATKDLFTNFDTAQTELSKVTATTGEYNDMLYDLQESNKTFGVDVEKAGKAIGDLHNELSSFNQMSSATQGMLAETTARMEVLGVKTGSGAKQFDNMIQGMGMTATMANDASMELVALGGAIGMAADTITDGFNAAASELAKYGSDAIDVFKGLASAAKATGIEMGSLMSITKQFDTFEGAAAGAGKLNAILGGGVINSMDLLNGTEEERIRLLIQSVAASGKNFESLNKFEKQAIASAAGISDMAEANKLFSMSLSAYDEMQAKGSEANEQAAMMEERAQAVQKLTDKFKMIGQSFAIAFMPVLEFMHGFANMILMINDMTGGMFVPAMVGLIGVIALLGKATAIQNATMAVGNGIMMARTLLTTGLGNAKAAYSLIMEGANLREKAGLALDLMSLPVKTAKNVATLKEGAAAATATAPSAAFAAALASISAAALPLLPAITAIGFAIGGLGLAIAAPFIAIAALAIAFKDLFIAMLEAPEAIMSAIVGIVGFAAGAAVAMNILALAMIPFSIAMFTASIFLFPAGLLLIPFATAMLIAAPAFYLFGSAVTSMSEGLETLLSIDPTGLIQVLMAMTIFTLGMLFLSPFLFVIGILAGIPLMLLGAGLKSFAKGMKEFNKLGGEEILMAVESLIIMTGLLMDLVLPLFVVGLLIGIPLMLLGAGLKSFAKGMKEYNKIAGGEIVSMLFSLIFLSVALIPVAFILTPVVTAIGLSLAAISLSLIIFAYALSTFNKVGYAEILSAVFSLLFLSAALLKVAVPLKVASDRIAEPLALIGLSLGVFALGLQQFNDVGAEGILLAVGSLLLFGVAMKVLDPYIEGMVVGFTMLAMPMMLFGAGLAVIGIGLLLIGAGMSTFIGLTDVLTVISAIGLSGAAAMGVLATSIMGIALALMFIPESKSIAFGFAMEGYGAALAAVAALSPETVELSERVVAAAGEYAEIQAEMRMPDEDSFVQAMKNAFGGDKKGDSGKNIILQLNGRELGRAVDVQLNKMHNLSID